MKKFLISYYKYMNDGWSDLEAIVEGTNKEEVLAKFEEENRLARKSTIKEI
jgi:hypothetical protein